MRYFEILDGKSGVHVAVADLDALGRMIADYLREYRVGSVNVRVYEITPNAFQAFKQKVGSFLV